MAMIYKNENLKIWHDSTCQISQSAYENHLFIKHTFLNADCVYDTMPSVGIINEISRQTKC